jgi:hypothetical protein
MESGDDKCPRLPPPPFWRTEHFALDVMSRADHRWIDPIEKPRDFGHPAPDFVPGLEPDAERIARERHAAALETAEREGLLGLRDRSIGGRIPSKLLDRALQLSGATSTTELLVHALAEVALEDDFGKRLVARKGRVPKGTLAD